VAALPFLKKKKKKKEEKKHGAHNTQHPIYPNIGFKTVNVSKIRFSNHRRKRIE